MGLHNVVTDMKRFGSQPGADAAFWTPAPLLLKLLAEGKPLV
jgi:3-hydroxyacyl-CoA dehydrogenase